MPPSGVSGLSADLRLDQIRSVSIAGRRAIPEVKSALAIPPKRELVKCGPADEATRAPKKFEIEAENKKLEP